jgi:hypothetical protein
MKVKIFFLVVVFSSLLHLYCETDGGQSGAAGGDQSGTPILDSTHTGWTDKWCDTSGCHAIPVTDHDSSYDFADCADCHGGNGAKHPENPGTTHDHLSTDDCMNGSCHGTHHGYTLNSKCVQCHFASSGTL